MDRFLTNNKDLSQIAAANLQAMKGSSILNSFQQFFDDKTCQKSR